LKKARKGKQGTKLNEKEKREKEKKAFRKNQLSS